MIAQIVQIITERGVFEKPTSTDGTVIVVIVGLAVLLALLLWTLHHDNNL